MTDFDQPVGRTNAARALMAERTAEVDGAFFVPHLSPGMNLLDCGCGEGTITLGLARLVSPGQVTGLDPDTKAIENARLTADAEQVANVTYGVGDIYALEFADESFDAVFAHMVFEHLADRANALAELTRVLKPGGIIALRSPDFASSLWWPKSEDIGRAMELRRRARLRLGGEPDMGRRLRAMLVEAGFEKVEASASYENFGTSDRTALYAEFYGSIWNEDNQYSGMVVDEGWATRGDLTEMVEGLHEWATHTGSYVADAAVGVVGRKPH